MNIFHGVFYYLSHLLHTFVGSQRRNSLTLNHDVAVSEQLDGLQSTSIWPNKPLPPLDELILVPDKRGYLYDVCGNVILEDSNCLLEGNWTSHELDHVARFKDDVWVPSLPGGLHCHASLDEIHLCLNVMLGERLLNQRPMFLQILLAVLRKHRRKRAFLEKAMWIIFLLKFRYLQRPRVVDRPGLLHLRTFLRVTHSHFRTIESSTHRARVPI